MLIEGDKIEVGGQTFMFRQVMKKEVEVEQGLGLPEGRETLEGTAVVSERIGDYLVLNRMLGSYVFRASLAGVSARGRRQRMVADAIVLAVARSPSYISHSTPRLSSSSVSRSMTCSRPLANVIRSTSM